MARQTSDDEWGGDAGWGAAAEMQPLPETMTPPPPDADPGWGGDPGWGTLPYMGGAPKPADGGLPPGTVSLTGGAHPTTATITSDPVGGRDVPAGDDGSTPPVPPVTPPAVPPVTPPPASDAATTTPTRPVGDVLPGWDATKWADPTHTSPKYVVGRILSKYPPTTAGLQEAWKEIHTAYPGATFDGKDSISGIPGTLGAVDVLAGASQGGTSWWWGDQGDPAVRGGAGAATGTGAGAGTGTGTGTSTGLALPSLPTPADLIAPPPATAPDDQNSVIQQMIAALLAGGGADTTGGDSGTPNPLD